MSTNFAALLATPAAAAKKPQPFPVGTYLCQVQKYEPGDQNKNKTPYVRVTSRVLGPLNDVDATAWAEAKIDLTKRTVRDDFFLTDDALYRLTEFMQNALGLELGQRSHAELLTHIPNRQFLAHMSQQASSKPGSTDMFNVIDAYAAVPPQQTAATG